eukprot:6180691-Pleurochrysis_carterae.AAC.10
MMIPQLLTNFADSGEDLGRKIDRISASSWQIYLEIIDVNRLEIVWYFRSVQTISNAPCIFQFSCSLPTVAVNSACFSRFLSETLQNFHKNLSGQALDLILECWARSPLYIRDTIAGTIGLKAYPLGDTIIIIAIMCIS